MLHKYHMLTDCTIVGERNRMQQYKGLKRNNGIGSVKIGWLIGRARYCWEYMDR